jgi:hypothetical protein
MPLKDKEKMLEYSRKYYKENTEKERIRKQKYHKNNYVEINGKKRNRTREKKDKLVQSKGGRCEHCQQSFSHPHVYDFHHKDPTTKEFGIGWALTRTSISIEDLLKEVDKCLMLCANCHRIEHVRLRGDLDEQGNST